MSSPAASLDTAARRAAGVPCLPAQRRIWLLDRMHPGHPALNVAARWRVQGRDIGPELDEAAARLVSRWPSLRTSVAEEDGAPVRRIAHAARLHVRRIDLTARAAGEARAEAELQAAREACAPFDLSAAPLLRITLLALGEGESIVLLTSHQLIAGEDTLEAWMRELAELCIALHERQRRRPALHAREWPPPREPRDARDERYWQATLAGLVPFELLPDRPRPKVRAPHGARLSRSLPASLVEGLRTLARDHDGSLPAIAMALLFMLLQRWSGATDIAIGMACSEPGVHEPPDIAVIRAGFADDPGVGQVLCAVSRAIAEAREHGSVSLQEIIELLEPQRDLSRNALVSVHFAFRGRSAADGDYGRFALSSLAPCAGGALYDLEFRVGAVPGGWEVSCNYNTALFEAATIERMLGHYINLARHAVEDPALTVSRIAMLDPAECAQLADLNRTQAPLPEAPTLCALLEAQAARTPKAVAVRCAGRSLTYATLERRANRLAHELRSRDAGRGSRVAVGLPRSTDLVVALLAVLKSGAAYVPLDPAYPPARLQQVMDDAKPLVTITTAALRARWPASAGEILAIDDEASAPLIAQQPGTPPPGPPAGGDAAYVIYTSGSTGRPKGVQVRHRSLVNLLEDFRRRLGAGSADTLLAVTTIAFDIAALELFLPLATGACVVLAEEGEAADGAALAGLLERHRVTMLQATPVTWQLLLACGWRGQARLTMLCGGEALPRALADALLEGGGALWNLYGPTETTVWSSALRVEAGSGPVPIGGPLANTQFHVLGPRGELLPFGAAGELHIGGEGVASGYWNLAALTRERFVPDPFRPGARMYRTGDRVRRRAGGGFEFLGRDDRQVKVRGFRVELGEIEAVLLAHPDVRECAAVTAADAAGQTAIHAYVATASRAPPQTLVTALRSRLRAALPAPMNPAALVVLPALPRTPNGKLDRRALPPPEVVREVARPLTALERQLAGIWSAVLGAPAPAPDANFFEVGGHSLLAVKLLARIEAASGHTLSLAALFAHPTIAAQAALLEGGAGRAFDFRQVVKLQAHGARPPLIAINNTGIYYALSRRLGSEQPFTSLQLFDPALPPERLPRSLPDIAAGYAQLIRRVQPSGPYALLGWCVAGTLAFEVARQLREGGARVSRLFLFDTLAPGHLRRLPWLRARLAEYAYRWKLIAADWRRTPRGARGLLEFLGNRVVVRRMLAAFGAAPRPLPPLPAPDLAAPALAPGEYDQWLLRYLEDAASAYEPAAFDAPITLFRSSGEPAGTFLDPLMGWGGFARGGIELVVVDGDHFNMFQAPRVSQLAQRIETALGAA